eukprot:537020-Pleurochrysis_carterae.AAC.2
MQHVYSTHQLNVAAFPYPFQLEASQASFLLAHLHRLSAHLSKAQSQTTLIVSQFLPVELDIRCNQQTRGL